MRPADRPRGLAIWLASALLLVTSGSTSPVHADLSKLSGCDRQPQDLGLAIPAGYPELETARNLLKEGKAEDAFEVLRNAAAAHSELPPARLLLAMLFFSAGDGPQGAAVLEQAAQEAPEHPEVYSTLGKLALAERRPAYARLAFEKAASLKPPTAWNEARRNQLAATCHDGLALLAESRQDWQAARAELSTLVQLEPGSGNAHHRLARALFQLELPDQALAELKAGSKLDALLEPPAVAMARLYAQAHNDAKASEWLAVASKENPDDPRVRVAVTRWLLEQGRFEEAEQQLKTAAALERGSRDLRRLQGLVARCLSKYAEAEGIFQALLQDTPGDTLASDQLALSLVDQADPSKWSRALQLAELNARAYPNDPTTLSTLGWVLLRYGRIEEAERALRTAATRGPIGSDAAYFLARALSARGRDDDARSLIQTALKTPGTFIYRRDAQQWLDSHPAKR